MTNVMGKNDSVVRVTIAIFNRIVNKDLIRR